MKVNTSPLIRPVLRSLVLALIVTALSSYVARAIPYASQVTTNGTTVSFVLNQTAAGMTLVTNDVPYVMDSSTTGIKSFDNTGVTSWSIIVTGQTAKAWTQFIPDDGASARNFYYPSGVAINKKPGSPNFGKVYIANNTRTTYKTGAGKSTPDGIYVLQADGEAVSGPHTGGVSWTADGTYYSRPYKLCVNTNDDRIYVSSFYDDLAFGFNDDLSVATQLIDASNKNATGTYLQYVESVYATGSQANGDLTLYAANSSYNDSTHRGVWYWTIGSGATVPVNDKGAQLIGPAGLSGYHVNDFDSDSSGNWYTTVYRSATGQAPDVKRFDAGTPPLTVPAWDADRTDNNLRSVAVNEAGGTVAVGNFSTGLVRFFDINTGVSKGSKDIGNAARDVAFDIVGNMVSVDNSTEYARFWSPGGNSVATTLSDGTFNLFVPDSLTVAATDSVATEATPDTTDTATFRITRSGGPALDLSVSYTLSGIAGDTVDYTVSPTSPFNFPAGQTTIDITVTPIDDTEREPTETVVLTLTASSTYNVDSPSSATATIVDNDATLRYWDSDGATAGAGGGGAPAGTWGTDAYWSPNAAGDVATGAWTDWAAAVFSAGADAAGQFSVTNSETQLVDYLNFEDGMVTLEGGTLTLTNFEAIKVNDRGRIQSVLDGAAGLALDGPGNLVLAGANTYTGPTLVNAGNLVVGADGGVIPDGSAVTIGATATLSLDDQLFGSGTHDETIGSLASSSGAQVNVPTGNTLTVGGNNGNATFRGTVNAEGTLVKVGSGTMTLTDATVDSTLAISNGMVSINASVRLGTSANDIIIDGGRLRNTGAGGAIAPYGRSIFFGASGGVLEAQADAIYYYGDASATGTLQGGTLIKDGPGELRVSGLAMANSSFEKLVVRDGLYRGGYVSPTQSENFLGATPSSFIADQITISNAARIDTSLNMLALNANRGIVLGIGGGRISGIGSMEINGVISGTQLLKDTSGSAMLVLRGANTYTDGTVLSYGSLYVRNTSGSGTGSGTVTVNGATLGGEGSIAGPVVMTGGTLTPGYNYTIFGGSTETKLVAKLVLGGGLDTTAGATTMNWQLGALSEANPGTDFDQVDVTGGNLALGSGATLAVGFTGTATAPDLSTFWQTSRSWQVIKYTGGTISGNFSTITGTGGAIGGTFSTTQDANGVNLVWTSSYVAPTQATISSSSVSGGNLTINYSGAAGNRFVLLRSPDVDALLSTWARVATNSVGTGSFVIPVGTDPKAFYSIQSE